MNKHIGLVKKWLADNDSVSLEELKANKEAYATYASVNAAFATAFAVYAASHAAYSAAYSATTADDVIYWVNKYEELTK